MKDTGWSSGSSVTGDGTGVVAHAGRIGLRMLAERIGLTGALSAAMTRRGFVPSIHDRGQVLTDGAVLLADGGEAISDINVLRHQSQVLGPVASADGVAGVGRGHRRQTKEDPDRPCPGPAPRLVPTGSCWRGSGFSGL